MIHETMWGDLAVLSLNCQATRSGIYQHGLPPLTYVLLNGVELPLQWPHYPEGSLHLTSGTSCDPAVVDAPECMAPFDEFGAQRTIPSPSELQLPYLQTLQVVSF